MSISLRLVKADLQTAKNNLSPAINLTNDEYLYNIAAYHVQQAVEKCLKIILHQYYGADDNSRVFRTHNIAALLGMIEDFSDSGQDCPVQISDYLRIMSADLTMWEASSRYNDDIVILRESIETVITECEKIAAQLEALGLGCEGSENYEEDQ